MMVAVTQSWPFLDREGPDRASRSPYPCRVITLATRILSTLALVAAMLWVAFPSVVVAAANPAHMEGEPCPCCDGQAALGGIIACPACQVGTPAATVPPIAPLTVTIAWLGVVTGSVTGIDPAPAEPPPR
jgi:hypothetical protein